MNVLMMFEGDIDIEKYISMFSNSSYCDILYCANSIDEINTILDDKEINLSVYICFVDRPSDFGTEAYDYLIKNDISEDKIIVIMHDTRGARRSHISAQIISSNIDNSMVDDILSHYDFEGESDD